MPEFVQLTSIKLWQDETHVLQNRELYRNKFDKVLNILESAITVEKPTAGFYLWLNTRGNDEEFAKGLYAQQNVTVLPGTYLSRESAGVNPGLNHVRIALVAELPECLEAAERIYQYVNLNH
jgi:N-succinyldiaminopimelate aminotransferase